MSRPFRALALDGGGMRGIYTAEYLASLTAAFARKRNVDALDPGRAFDLIVGTSTGAVIACTLAAGIPLRDVVSLYRDRGRAIFPRKIPSSFPSVLFDAIRRPTILAKGTEALRSALADTFGGETVAGLYSRRGIAIAIPAVEMTHHRSWVFKSPHIPSTNHRDADYTLVDICMASTAAPLFRSLAHLKHPNGHGYNVFADGGLWANTPVLVALVDALQMRSPDDEIEIFSVSTCSRRAGEQISPGAIHRGYRQWRFGADAAVVSIEAQEFAYSNMARMLANYLANCHVVRFPQEPVPSEFSKYLDLDETRPEAMNALLSVARADANMTNSICGTAGHPVGERINRLFMEMPELEVTDV